LQLNFRSGYSREIFVVVGVVQGLLGIRARQIARIGLTVSQIVGARHHVEVAQLVDNGAGAESVPVTGAVQKLLHR
jgi:hypothetical protein